MSTQRGHFPYLVSMKYLILPLILIPTIAHAQKGIQTENGRKLYLGTNNRLEVGAEKTKPGSIELSTDNGKIIKDTTHPGIFIMQPAHIGKASVLISQWLTKNVVHNDSVIYEVVEK
jgi:hypothetical protein